MDVLVTHRDKLIALAEKLVAEETVDPRGLREPVPRPAPEARPRARPADRRRPEPADPGAQPATNPAPA